MMNNKKKIFWTLLLLIPCFVFSQNPSVQTTADRKDILIGEQVKLTIKTILPLNSTTKNYSLLIPDSVQHFDIIDKGKADTINYKDDSKAIEQTITLTSFDSGSWYIPSFRINLEPLKADTSLNLFTDSLAINVMYSPADTTNQLRDIKPIMQVTVNDYTWLYIAGGILLLLVVAYLLWRYYKKRKQQPADILQSKLSPYDEAMQELEKLNGYNLQNADEIKLYHISLSNIFKRYNTRKQNRNLLNKTTGDLLIEMSTVGLSTEDISALATVLRTGDAVKFAKYQPGIIESEDSKIKIKETIKIIEQQTSNTNQ